MYSAIRFLSILVAAARTEAPVVLFISGGLRDRLDRHRFPSAILDDA
jgi:hypothetical protein